MEEKAIGIWVRVSDVKQVETESHLHHEVRAKDFVQSRGWTVKRVYRLEAMSGKSIMHYSETKQMLKDIKTGVITGLVFSKVARLARNTKELIEISEVFREYKADLISMDMSIDTSTPIGRHFFRQMSSMAEWERETIVDRINSSIKTRVKLGKQIAGRAPFGFQYVDKKLTVQPEEAPICKLIYSLFLENKRKRTTAKILNERGHRTRTGSKFSYSTVNRILTDPVYKGLQRMNYSTVVNGKRTIKPQEEWVFHNVEAIVSEQVWDSVNHIIQKQLKAYVQPLNTKVHLFTSYAYCNCGGKMVTRSNTQNYLCTKKCGNKIHKEDLEEVFKSELQAYTVSQENIDQYFNQIESIVEDKQKELATLEKKKKKVNTTITSLIELHAQGQIETSAFRDYHEKPYQQLNQIKESIESLNTEISGFSSQENVTQFILKEAQDLYQKWDDLTHQQKRNIIEIITENIIIAEQEITINLYKLLPDQEATPFFELETNGHHNH